jgi:hypothetical protein
MNTDSSRLVMLSVKAVSGAAVVAGGRLRA